MVAHVLGADAILTEQKELLSLLERNLSTNFPQTHVQSASATESTCSESPNNDHAAADSDQFAAPHIDSTAAAAAAAAASCGTDANEAVTCARDTSCSSSNNSNNSSSGAATTYVKAARIQAVQLDWEHDAASSLLQQHLNGRYPDFILSADCVYVPLYGDSWRALITVLTGLSGPHTVILVSVERRTADGIDDFLAAAAAAGLTVQCVYESTAAGMPIELYAMQKAVQDVADSSVYHN
jgi:Lysine methyltransferase